MLADAFNHAGRITWALKYLMAGAPLQEYIIYGNLARGDLQSCNHGVHYEQLVLIPRYLVEQMLTIGKQIEASLASFPPNAMPVFTKLDDTLKKIIGEFFKF